MSLFESDDEIISRNPSTMVFDWLSKNVLWNYGSFRHKDDWKRFIKVIPKRDKFIFKCTMNLRAEFLSPLPQWLIMDKEEYPIITIDFLIHSQDELDVFPSAHKVSNNSHIQDLTFYTGFNSIIFEGPVTFKNVSIVASQNDMIDCRIDSFRYDVNNLKELHFFNTSSNSMTFINPAMSVRDAKNLNNLDKYKSFINNMKRLRVDYFHFAFYTEDDPKYFYYKLEGSKYVLQGNY